MTVTIPYFSEQVCADATQASNKVKSVIVPASMCLLIFFSITVLKPLNTFYVESGGPCYGTTLASSRHFDCYIQLHLHAFVTLFHVALQLFPGKQG